MLPTAMLVMNFNAAMPRVGYVDESVITGSGEISSVR